MSAGADAPEDDLSADAVATALGARPTRVYPAILSTHADALAWARAGAPSGAVVVSDYQVSPRGRAGLEWTIRPGLGLGFSYVARPDLPAEREGWVYLAAGAALAGVVEDAAGDVAVELIWPDEVHRGDRRLAAVGVHTELGASAVEWAVVTVLLEHATSPRGPLLARAAAALDAALAAPPEVVLARWRDGCRTIGTQVRARMIPMGPGGTVVEGEAVGVKDDGALLIERRPGLKVAVLPTHLGVLDQV